MNMAADPIITLNQGQHLDVPVEITQCEGRISFVLLWENMAAQVQFTVRAPDGTVFTPSAAASNRLVRYIQRPGYRFYQIALPPGPGATIGPKQIGQWTMRIDPTFIPGGTTRASTNVMVDSALQMTATITANRIIDPMLVRTQIYEHGTLVRNAKVTVRLTAPVQSLVADRHAVGSPARARGRSPSHSAEAANPDQDAHDRTRREVQRARVSLARAGTR